MKIAVRWLPPVDLYDGSSENLIYSCDLEQILEDAGVYVFARRFGKVWPRSMWGRRSLRGRIKQQFNNTKLMKGVENAKIGTRVLLLAEVSTWLASRLLHALVIVERTLIEHYLSQGCELINIQGTKIPADIIEFAGNSTGRHTCPSVVAVPKNKHLSPEK